MQNLQTLFVYDLMNKLPKILEGSLWYISTAVKNKHMKQKKKKKTASLIPGGSAFSRW